MAGGAMFDEFSQGGLLDDADVVVLKARFENWDYKGKSSRGPVLALAVWLLDLNDAESKPVDEHLSAGDLKFFVPSADGKAAMPVGTQMKLNVNTNAAAFIISLMNGDTRGAMAQKLKTSDDISQIEGIVLHVKRKDQPKRPGIVAEGHVPEGGVQGRTPQQLIVTAVHAYAGENPQATAAFQRGLQMMASMPPAGAVAIPVAASPFAAPMMAPTPVAASPFAAPAAAPVPPPDLRGVTATAPVGDQTVADAAAALLLRIAAGNGNQIKKGAIAGKVFSDDEMKAAAAPFRNAVLGMIVQPAFLASAAVANFGMRYDPTSDTVILG